MNTLRTNAEKDYINSDNNISSYLLNNSLLFFKNHTTKRVLFYSNGSVKPFKEIPKNIEEMLTDKLIENTSILRKLKDYPDSEILEKYVYHYFLESIDKKEITSYSP